MAHWLASGGGVRLAAMGFALPDVYRLTFHDWLSFPDDGRAYEIVDGELFVTPSPSIRHQRTSREIQHALLTFLRATGLGEVLNAPVGVKLDEGTVVEPDIVVVLKAHAGRIGEQVIEGAPDIVIEILSPGTAQRDLGIKRNKYETCGVPEYWIVDAEARGIEVLSLHSGRYSRSQAFGGNDTLTSPSLPGFAVDVSDVFVG